MWRHLAEHRATLYPLSSPVLFNTKPLHIPSISTDPRLCSPPGLKLKRGGSGRLLGSWVPRVRSSSKKLWAQASSGESLEDGVYSSRLEQSAMASGGVRDLNTCGLVQRVRGAVTPMSCALLWQPAFQTPPSHQGDRHMRQVLAPGP